MVKERFERYVILAQRLAARVVLFQDAAAKQLGLTATELKCFRLVQHQGAVTASDLAQETGLTPASLSVVVDKLVARKFLAREQDISDRRRWLLKANGPAVGKVDAIFAAHAREAEHLLDDFSDPEFEVVLRFMTTFADALRVSAMALGTAADAMSESTNC